jgi:hypothetical protein
VAASHAATPFAFRAAQFCRETAWYDPFFIRQPLGGLFMRRGLSLLAFVALAIGGVAAGIFVSGGGASTAATLPTKINVTASEF